MNTESVEAGGPAPDGRAAAGADMPIAADIRPVGGGLAETRCTTHPAVPSSTAAVGPITRADAERALALAGNDITVLQRRVEAVHQAAWARAWNGLGSQGLAYDLRRVKSEVANWLNPMIHKPPKRVEAAMVLLDAERRWSGVKAATWDPLAMMAARGVPVVKQAAPVSPQQIIARLSGKGISLALSAEGKIVAMPAGVLGETERALVQEHREALKLALASAEVLV